MSGALCYFQHAGEAACQGPDKNANWSQRLIDTPLEVHLASKMDHPNIVMVVLRKTSGSVMHAISKPPVCVHFNIRLYQPRESPGVLLAAGVLLLWYTSRKGLT